MKTIVLRKFLPHCVTFAKSQEETIKDALLKPLMHKPQGNKASSTKSLLKKADMSDQLNFYDLPNYLTLYNSDKLPQIGIPAFYNKNLSEDLNESDIKSIKSKFKERNMHCILPSFSEFKNQNFDAYGMQRMNNIFNYSQWNDMYIKYKDDYSYKDHKTLNKLFVDEVVTLYEEGDAIVILDHSLWLSAKLLRDKLPNANIGIVCLQPMPNLEAFKTFLNPSHLLDSMLCADVLEFQSQKDLSKFVLSASVIVNASYREEAQSDKTIKKCLGYETRNIALSVNKFVVDMQNVKEIVKDKKFQDKTRYFEERYKNKKIILAVASHVNSSTITDVLMGVEAYLYKYGNGIALVVLEVPEGKVDFEVKQENYRMMEHINLTNESCMLETYAPTDDSMFYALMYVANVALILTERSSLSKPALEYLAIQKGKGGKLVVSKFASFAENINITKVNPKDTLEIADAIRSELYPDEASKKADKNDVNIDENFTQQQWMEDFCQKVQTSVKQTDVVKVDFTNLKMRFQNAKKRLFCLDYDGTLTKIVPNPLDAKPDEELLCILKDLTGNDKNDVYICTGRGRKIIDEWISDNSVNVSAEHGLSFRENGEWKVGKFKIDWKDSARQIIQFFVERTPGAHIEEKENGLVFHVRQSDVKIQEVQIKALKGILLKIFKDRGDVHVVDGKCVLEIRSGLMNKGHALLKLEDKGYDFIFVAGDDKTDEDMFRIGVNSKKINTVVVGNHKSCAKYKVSSVEEMRKLLVEMANL